MNIHNILRKGRTKLDAVLDYSEFYDFKLGNSRMDYTYDEIIITIRKYLITDDNAYIVTDDNYFIEYD